MYIKNLKENMIVKNYKELCILIGEEIKTSNSKKAQLKEFERFCQYHRNGQKFIIDEIYKEPLPKISDKSLNHSKYIKEIEYILVDYLYENVREGETIQLSTSSLIQILAMANNTYAVGCYKKYELAEILNMEISAIILFYNTSRTEFHKIIDRALKNLQNRAVLNVNTCYMITYKDGDMKKTRKANVEESQYIIDTQKDVLQYMGLNSFQDLFLAGGKKYKEYMKLFKKELPKEWIFTYKAYDLCVGTKAIAIEKANLDKERNKLNEKLINRIHTCLKVKDENSNEGILINRLVDLKGYDSKIDDMINDLYKQHKVEYYKQLNNKEKEIHKMYVAKESFTDDYENRDCVELKEYFACVNKIFKNNKYEQSQEYWDSLFDMIDNL